MALSIHGVVGVGSIGNIRLSGDGSSTSLTFDVRNLPGYDANNFKTPKLCDRSDVCKKIGD